MRSPIHRKEQTMTSRKSLTATGEQISVECRHLIRDYERTFGPIPFWVHDELRTIDKMRLITWAVEVMTPLPESKSESALTGDRDHEHT
jgi:hypothetical protein